MINEKHEMKQVLSMKLKSSTSNNTVRKRRYMISCPACMQESPFSETKFVFHKRTKRLHFFIEKYLRFLQASKRTMNSQYAMMEEDRPPLLHRSYSARTLDQCDPPNDAYHDCYLQFQPDGSTRTIYLSSNAASFDEGILAVDGNFQRRELPPRAPRKHRSHHPSQQFYHSTAPRHPPMLERRKSGYRERNHGSFPRENDDLVYSKLPLRRPSLSAISPDPRGFSSSRSLMTPKKKSTKRGRRKKAEQKSFQPQRSNSIYRKFDKKVAPKQDDDDDDEVWVERLILNGPEGVKKTCFKSLRGNVTRNEPPTGASTIVYLEDIIVDRDGRPSMTKAKSRKQARKEAKKKPLEPKKEQTASSQPQKPEETLEPKSQKHEESETKTENKKKVPKGQLKRRSSFFGMLKKNRKNKIGDAKNE